VEGALARAKPSSLTRQRWERVWRAAAAVRGFGLGPMARGARQRASEVTSQIRLAAENAAVGGAVRRAVDRSTRQDRTALGIS